MSRDALENIANLAKYSSRFAVVNVFCGSIECERQVNGMERWFDNLNALPLIATELCDDTPLQHLLKMQVYLKLKVRDE